MRRVRRGRNRSSNWNLCAAGEFALALSLASCGSSTSPARDAATRDAAPRDAVTRDSATVADSAPDSERIDAFPQCGTTISEYCGSDGGSCRTPLGTVSTRWDLEQQEASQLCSGSQRLTVETCTRYVVVTVGSVDTSLYLYYDLSTLELVSIKQNSFSVGPVCVAGLSIGSVDCPADAMPASLCQTTDGGAG